MNQQKSFCPGCKKEVVFAHGAGKSTCPVCGFSFELSQPQRELSEPSDIAGILGTLLKVFLIMVAIVVVASAVLFAGCMFIFQAKGLK